MASQQRGGAGGGGGGQKRLALPTITTTAPGSNQEKLSIPVSCHLYHLSPHDDSPYDDSLYDDHPHPHHRHRRLHDDHSDDWVGADDDY